MLPGKKYTPEDYVLAVWRRKWLLVIPTVLAWLGAFFYAESLPNRYRAEARILVVAQQVPAAYVKPTVTATLQERLQSMSQQILSRTRLEQIIGEFNLYADERKSKVFEDIIEQMRSKDIRIDVPKTKRREDPGYFTIGFEASDARAAVNVTNKLVSLFIDANTNDRATQSQQTSAFLESQVEDARRRLEEQDRQIQAFKSANAGTLPSQAQSNLQLMQSTQSQIQALADTISHDKNQQLVLEQTIADLQATPAPVRTSSGGEAAPTSLAEQLAQARATVTSLELRLRPDHPDLRRAKAQLAELQKAADAESANTPLTPNAAPPSSVPAPQQQRLSQMKAQHDSLGREIAYNIEQQQRLEKQLAVYRERVEAVPQRETQLAVLTRDYETLQDAYRRLLTQSEAAKVAADLERRQIGQSLKVVDNAHLPEQPTNPNRLRLNAIGFAGGLGLGVLLIAFFEYRDTTLKTDDDIIASLALPVLAVVPNMITAAERKRTRRLRIATVSASVCVVLIAVAAVAWKLRLLDGLVQ